MELPELDYWQAGGRVICTVLQEMRDCVKTLNFASMPGLIEEAQSMANRMESALDRNKDWKLLRSDLKKLEAVREKYIEEIKSIDVNKDNSTTK